MMARTGCGTDTIVVLSDETDEVVLEQKLQNDVVVTTSDVIVDIFRRCLRSSIFRRFFSFRRCSRSWCSFWSEWGLVFVAGVVGLAVIILSTGTVVILIVSADFVRSMTSKAHLSNLQWFVDNRWSMVTVGMERVLCFHGNGGGVGWGWWVWLVALFWVLIPTYVW